MSRKSLGKACVSSISELRHRPAKDLLGTGAGAIAVALTEEYAAHLWCASFAENPAKRLQSAHARLKTCAGIRLHVDRQPAPSISQKIGHFAINVWDVDVATAMSTYAG